MEKKPLQAKNVVSFGDGTRIARPQEARKTAAKNAAPVDAPAAQPVAEAVEASEFAVKKNAPAFIKKEAAKAAVETAADVENEVSEMAPPRKAPEPEAIEMKPLNLRQDRYLDEEPQEPDWADEEDEFDDEDEDEFDDDEEEFDEEEN
jgi:hypothetical protein